MGETIGCPRCGVAAPLDAARPRSGRQPVCRSCGVELRVASRVVEVSDVSFDDQVLGSTLPVLLDVWAPWCVPCRGMEAVIEELAASLAGTVRVAKLNLDRSPDAAARLRIQGVPTLFVFKAGQEVARMVGVRDKAELLKALAVVA